MKRILVNAPTGKQELIEVGDGGGYFEPTRVIWDERADGDLPTITLGGMKRVGSALVFDQAVMDATNVAGLPDLKLRLVDNIDSTIAEIYNRWLRFEAEYVAREAAARTFKAASYTGDPGIWVTAFATAAGMTTTAASNLIISQADSLRGALQALGALRMSKYAVQAASSLASAQQAHDTIITQAMAIASAL